MDDIFDDLSTRGIPGRQDRGGISRHAGESTSVCLSTAASLIRGLVLIEFMKQAAPPLVIAFLRQRYRTLTSLEIPPEQRSDAAIVYFLANETKFIRYQSRRSIFNVWFSALSSSLIISRKN